MGGRMPVVRKHVSRRAAIVASTLSLAMAGTVALVAGAPAGASSPASTAHRSVPSPGVLIGAITGRVMDSLGQGVQGICVAALNRGAVDGAAVTTATGTYLIGAVPRGRYRLRFTSCASSARHETTTYPSTTSNTPDREIAVAAGRLVDAGDVVLPERTGRHRPVRTLGRARGADAPRSLPRPPAACRER